MNLLSHFSHRHPLQISTVKEEDDVICSGCELDLYGLAYVCAKLSCHFFLHQSCTELPRQIRHKSHSKHPLVLQIAPPYSYGEFICKACANTGHAFGFHCSSCKYDLHVECASLPETEKRESHEHPLTLVYLLSSEYEMERTSCDECPDDMVKGCWLYGCLDCRYYVHLQCGIGHEGL